MIFYVKIHPAGRKVQSVRFLGLYARLMSSAKQSFISSIFSRALEWAPGCHFCNRTDCWTARRTRGEIQVPPIRSWVLQGEEIADNDAWQWKHLVLPLRVFFIDNFRSFIELAIRNIPTLHTLFLHEQVQSTTDNSNSNNTSSDKQKLIVGPHTHRK